MHEKKDIRILLLEDQSADVELITHLLKQTGYPFKVKRVETKEAFVSELQKQAPDLILSDYSLPSFDGLSALAIAQKKRPNVPFIFVTGTLGEEVAIETLKSGATDYILKTRLSRLVPAVHRALRENKDRLERLRAEDRLRRSHAQLRALSTHLQNIREEERTRISREVHDELGQALTRLKMDLSQFLLKLPETEHGLLKKVRAMCSDIDSTIQTVRRISTELRPGILDNLGLAAAIEWQAQDFQQRTGIRCFFHIQTRGEPLDNEINTTVFRIFQETLTNVIRHAEATRIDIMLKQSEREVILEVKDNGKGIEPEEIVDVKSIGILGMKERANLLDGDVNISGAPGRGTSVRVMIPCHKEQAQRGKTIYENTDRRRSRRGKARVEADTRK